MGPGTQAEKKEYTMQPEEDHNAFYTLKPRRLISVRIGASSTITFHAIEYWAPRSNSKADNPRQFWRAGTRTGFPRLLGRAGDVVSSLESPLVISYGLTPLPLQGYCFWVGAIWENRLDPMGDAVNECAAPPSPVSRARDLTSMPLCFNAVCGYLI